MTRRAGVYVRISSDPEGEALGVDRQERDCRKLVRRHRWEVADLYRDNDITASGKKRRPEWERLLQDLDDGTIDAVVAYSSSRMYRRPADLARLVKLAEERDLEVDTVVSGRIDLTTADGRMVAGILAQVDQGELERLTERVKRAMLDKATSGERWGGRRPFGYRKDLRKEPREARAIRKGADMVLGGSSASAVARYWNDHDVLTPSGKRWSVTRVKAVLSRSLIAGLREHASGTYQGTWDPIVTVEEHEALKALLGRRTGTGRPIARRHPLTGTLVCGECGTALSGRTQPDGRRSYACPTGQGGCGHVAIGAVAAEDFVLDAVQHRDPTYVKKHRLTTPQRLDRQAALALVEVARKRTVLQEAAQLGVDVTAKMRELDDEERTLQDRVRVEPRADDPEKDDPRRRDRRHAGELTEAEVEQSAAWVRHWVDQVVVRKAKSTRELAAGRLQIVWR